MYMSTASRQQKIVLIEKRKKKNEKKMVLQSVEPSRFYIKV